MPAPDFSVLLPLQEDRGEGEACVRAWSRDQTIPRERYELVVLAPGLDPLLELVVRPLLAPGDQWIVHATPNEYELFNMGAESARGRFVFPTEAHCVPTPDCLEQMLAHLEATGGPGARGASVGESETRLGALEQEAYERDMAIGEDDDHWRKVLIHSLAIRRDVFFEAGGFEPQYGDFAGWALDIALRERGHRLTFTPDSAVRHRYTGELGVLREHIRDFAHGEMLFCSRVPAAVRRRYLLDSREWAERAAYTRQGARRALRAALAARRPGQAARHLATAGLGPRAAVLAARAQMRFHRVRVLALPGQARRRAYLAFWAACARMGRIEWLAGSPQVLRSAARPSTADLTDLDAAGLTGFHGLEEHRGQLFRWTSPLAVACVDLPEPRPYRVELQLLPLRPPDWPARLRVATEVGQVQAHGAERLTFTVNGGGVRSVALACEPFRPRRFGSVDRRDLGVAVRSIKFTPA